MRQNRNIFQTTLSWMALPLIGWLAAACVGDPTPAPAPSPIVIEREVVRNVPQDVVVEKQVVRTIEVEKPVIKEVIKTVEVEKPVVREVVKTIVKEVPVSVPGTPVIVTKEIVVVATPTAAPPAPTPHPDTRTVMDDVGREVEIPFRPQRIAVTNSWMVEVLMSCGHAPVARPQIPLEFVYPPAAHDIPVIAVSHSAGPNLEQLAAARPDLVLTSPTYGRFAEPVQQALGVPVLVYNVDTVSDVLEKVQTLGSLAGCEAKAQQAVADLRAKISQQQEGLPETGPDVFAIFGTSESFLGFTSASYLGDMVTLLGGSMITDGDPPYVYRGIPDPAYTPFSLEKVVESDPDAILVVRHGAPSQAREANFSGLFTNPAWAGLTAIDTGRLHELSEWLYIRYPGPRVTWAMAELRPLLYSDAQREAGGG